MDLGDNILLEQPRPRSCGPLALTLVDAIADRLRPDRPGGFPRGVHRAACISLDFEGEPL
jgi:hypothetical protein